MRKIRLDPERLRIESFDTTAAHGERGTVQGRATTDLPYCSLGHTSVGSCDTACENTYCGTCHATDCGTCGEASCGYSNCPTCDPYCCETASCS